MDSNIALLEPEQIEIRDSVPIPVAEPRKNARPHAGRRAKKKKKKPQRLTQIEKALLADFGEVTKLVDAYNDAEAQLLAASEKFEEARAALRSLDPIKAGWLAHHDSRIAEILLQEAEAEPQPR